jgi:transposase
MANMSQRVFNCSTFSQVLATNSSGLTCPQLYVTTIQYSTVYWYYKQWRSQGVIEKLMGTLHSQVRSQVKKKTKWTTLMIPSKKQKEAEGKSGFVPVKARWVIERSNAWMERCKILTKNFERTLDNATAKMNLCFIRLMIKRLAS